MCGRYFLKRDTRTRRFCAYWKRWSAARTSNCAATFSRRPRAGAGGRAHTFHALGLCASRRRAARHQRPQRDGGEKPLFRGAGRCLLPASGYYEWGGAKAPLRLHPAGRRGVYGRPLAAGGGRGKRFVILTREADGGGGARARAHARAVHGGAAPRLAGRRKTPAGAFARGGDVSSSRRTLTQKRVYDTILATYTKAGGAL